MIGTKEFNFREETVSDLLAKSGLDFELPTALEAIEPPEARGLTRDQVRLLISHYKTDRIEHTRFHELPEYIAPGDLLVINTSGTWKAALTARREDSTNVALHLSSQLPAGLWIVELRQMTNKGTEPFFFARAGEKLTLPDRGLVTLLSPYDPKLRTHDPAMALPVRLWVAKVELPVSPAEYLDRFGAPIRYKYIKREWSIEYYQNVYATELGSAEMPSAGRAFTPELITRLVAMGVQVAPLILHTGVSSLESNELPHEEYYRIPVQTADCVNRARMAGRRVIAVGTTVMRALETVVDQHGIVHAAEGWTNKIIHADQNIRSVDGLLTGFHESRATHLAILAALASYEHLRRVYREAISKGYLWHEFGDLHLILP